jgi:hypothetical protein
MVVGQIPYGFGLIEQLVATRNQRIFHFEDLLDQAGWLWTRRSEATTSPLVVAPESH